MGGFNFLLSGSFHCKLFITKKGRSAEWELRWFSIPLDSVVSQIWEYLSR